MPGPLPWARANSAEPGPRQEGVEFERCERKRRYAGKQLSGAQWIEAMGKDPILIERPIIVRGEQAVLGRPPENVRRLLETRAHR